LVLTLGLRPQTGNSSLTTEINHLGAKNPGDFLLKEITKKKRQGYLEEPKRTPEGGQGKITIAEVHY